MTRPVLPATCIIACLVLFLPGCEGDPGRAGVSRLSGDLLPPTVEIVLPDGEKPLFEGAVVELIASDDVGIAGIQFLVDGRPDSLAFRALQPYYQYRWDLTALTEGLHRLQVIVHDAAGKVGLSQNLAIRKAPLAERPERDTLYTFAGETASPIDWKFPPDSLVTYDAIAARFTPNGPAYVRSLEVKVKLKAAWRGGSIDYELYSERDGRPDSLLATRTLSFPRREELVEYVGWEPKSFPRPGIPVEGEFFVVVRFTEGGTGDSVIVQSDSGLRVTGHGYQRRDGTWSPLTGQRFRRPNPLIAAVVTYR
ncbi:MAG: hypothetical protein FJY67_03820 [Calditrichaeota bacterium]|nr:hypothetical protein [Calditrichota bacterium]